MGGISHAARRWQPVARVQELVGASNGVETLYGSGDAHRCAVCQRD
jgi:hypothetical protein